MSDLFNILIVGCGYVGTPLAARLVSQGHRVWALRRNPPEPSPSPGPELASGIRWIRADVTDRSSLEAIPNEIQGIFYTAACSRARGDDPEAIYHQGVQNVLGHATERGWDLRRIVFTSSTGVYGQTEGAWVNEDSPTHPNLPAGRAMLSGEGALAACPWSSVSIRYSGIYGPERIRMLRMVSGPDRPVLAARDHVWLNQIHRDDCVGALLHAWELENPPAIFVASDHRPATRLEVLSWLAARQGTPGPLVDPSLETPPRLRGNKRVDGSRLRASGYTFIHPSYQSGYRSLIERT